MISVGSQLVCSVGGPVIGSLQPLARRQGRRCGDHERHDDHARGLCCGHPAPDDIPRRDPRRRGADAHAGDLAERLSPYRKGTRVLGDDRRNRREQDRRHGQQAQRGSEDDVGQALWPRRDSRRLRSSVGVKAVEDEEGGQAEHDRPAGLDGHVNALTHGEAGADVGQGKRGHERRDSERR